MPSLAADTSQRKVGERGERGFLRPAVVGLARRRSHGRVDEHDRARDLVAGEVLGGSAPAAPRATAGCRRTPGRSSTTAVTCEPKRSLGVPTTVASNTAGWRLSAFSTSSGKIFSPPELIDTDPAPVDDDGAVGVDRRQVAGHRVAHAVDHRERRRGLLLVLVVAERDVPAVREHPDPAVARLAQRAVVGDHDVAGFHRRTAARRRCRYRRAGPARRSPTRRTRRARRWSGAAARDRPSPTATGSRRPIRRRAATTGRSRRAPLDSSRSTIGRAYASPIVINRLHALLADHTRARTRDRSRRRGSARRTSRRGSRRTRARTRRRA